MFRTAFNHRDSTIVSVSACALRVAVSHVVSRCQDDETPIQLTPEQQKQLALIESMPLTMETEISQEEWAQKTPEEKERIMGKVSVREEGSCLSKCTLNCEIFGVIKNFRNVN